MNSKKKNKQNKSGLSKSKSSKSKTTKKYKLVNNRICKHNKTCKHYTMTGGSMGNIKIRDNK